MLYYVEAGIAEDLSVSSTLGAQAETVPAGQELGGEEA
jgi:hypothetical protein